MTLHSRLTDANAFITLYGTTPPRADAAEERIAQAAERLATRLTTLPLDGIVVYDVQNEAGRTTVPRPFPYLPTIDPRRYSQRLRTLIKLPTITYKCIADMTPTTWPAWLTAAHEDFGVEYLSLVGLPTTRGQTSAMPLSQATKMAATHPGNFTLGGVAIAERHRHGQSESLRIHHKTTTGCQYFISQAVYDPAPTIAMLTAYARECAERQETPRRIILTFTPCGRPKTLAFIQWLGVALADSTIKAILNDPAPLQRSIAICRDNFRAILEHPAIRGIPLGLNVESVSIYKDEIDASLELYAVLREVAQEYGLLANPAPTA